jgi:hypothetical protein
MTKIPVSVKTAATVGSPNTVLRNGIYQGSVVNTSDPLRQGRVTLSVPQILGSAVSNWAVPLGPFKSLQKGASVYAMFLGGDVNHPVFVPTGFLFSITPSGDTSGVTDTAAIQNAINTSGFALCGLGQFYLNAPIILQKNALQLLGSGGPTQSGDGASLSLGTVFNIVSGFTVPAAYSSFAKGAIILIDQTPGSGNPNQSTTQCVLKNFWVNGSTSPAGIDGIDLYGPCNATSIEHVGVYNVTGRGISGVSDTGTNNFVDGLQMNAVIIQIAAGHGVYGGFADCSLIDVHAQSCGGDGFYINNGGNARLIGCRSDLNNNGYTFDAGLGGGFYDSITLDACGTQGNTNYGLNVVNSSTTGTTARVPVIATGCSFDQDGVSSIYVSGRNLVSLVGCNMFTGNAFAFNSGGTPATSITAAGQGTAPGHPAINVVGGSLNPMTQVISGQTNASVLLVNNAVSSIGLTPASTTYTAYSNGDPWHNVTGYQHSWSAGSGGFQYRLSSDARSVILSGSMNVGSGTEPITVFTLPVGYRPLSAHRLAISRDSSNTYFDGALEIETDGTAQATGVTNSAVWYVEATFPIDR